VSLARVAFFFLMLSAVGCTHSLEERTALPPSPVEIPDAARRNPFAIIAVSFTLYVWGCALDLLRANRRLGGEMSNTYALLFLAEFSVLGIAATISALLERRRRRAQRIARENPAEHPAH